MTHLFFGLKHFLDIVLAQRDVKYSVKIKINETRIYVLLCRGFKVIQGARKYRGVSVDPIEGCFAKLNYEGSNRYNDFSKGEKLLSVDYGTRGGQNGNNFFFLNMYASLSIYIKTAIP